MKTRTHKMQAVIALFALLTLTMVLCIATAPAMAGTPRLDRSVMDKVLHNPGDFDRLHEVLDRLIPSGVTPEVAEPPLPDGGPFPDGGGWEPVFPDEVADDAVPAGDADTGDEAADETVDEVCEEEVADRVDDEAVGEESVERDDEAVDETAADEPVDEVIEQEEPQQEEPQQSTDEAVELPFTGGNSTPWLIAGAAVIFAGANLLFRRRPRNENR